MESNAGHRLGKFESGAFTSFISRAMDLSAAHNGISAPKGAGAIQISSAIRVVFVFHKQLVRHILVIDRYVTSGRAGRKTSKKKTYK
jgi:hypothetical protein